MNTIALYEALNVNPGVAEKVRVEYTDGTFHNAIQTKMSVLYRNGGIDTFKTLSDFSTRISNRN